MCQKKKPGEDEEGTYDFSSCYVTFITCKVITESELSLKMERKDDRDVPR